jgi:epoxyqueuosine reductase QueG
LSGEGPNLKQQAVSAGLGSWGRNSLVLHPEWGPWLRLMGIKITGAKLSPSGSGSDSHEENPLCKDCTACIVACPLGILEDYWLRDRESCLARVTRSSQKGKIVACDRCLVVCPIGRDKGV